MKEQITCTSLVSFSEELHLCDARELKAKFEVITCTI